MIASKVTGMAPSKIKTMSKVLTPLTIKTPKPPAPTAAAKVAALTLMTRAVRIPQELHLKQAEF